MSIYLSMLHICKAHKYKENGLLYGLILLVNTKDIVYIVFVTLSSVWYVWCHSNHVVSF